MLPSLRFAQRATDGNPQSAFFKIADGRVTGFNGTIAMSAPLQLSFNAAPAAVPFVKAINACEGVVSIAQESAHKIIVTSGKFKASIPCIPIKEVQSVEPEGKVYGDVTNLVECFKVLRPFLVDEVDTGKDWSRNIRVSKGYAYVTDNTVLIQYWFGTVFPVPINIPLEAISEVIHIPEKLESVQMNENSITFHFENGLWLRSQLNISPWPNIEAIIDKTFDFSKLSKITEEFREACLKLGKFGGKDHLEIYFRGTDMATSRKETNDIATIQIEAPASGCYAVKHLNKILNVATSIDFTSYPKPACFIGKNLRGIFVGVREE